MVERAELGGAAGVELWRRTVGRLTWAAVAANCLGALVMFLLLGFLVPFAPDGTDRELVLNGIVAAIYSPAALVLGTAIARRRGSFVERWIEAGRPPTTRERGLVLGEPMQTVYISGFFWVLAALVHGDQPAEPGWSALIVGRHDAAGRRDHLCGRIPAVGAHHRPITVLALAGRAPPERCGPGVARRLAMAWSLGTGIPLLGILVIATAGLVHPNEDPALLAATIALPRGCRAAGRLVRDRRRGALGGRADRRGAACDGGRRGGPLRHARAGRRRQRGRPARGRVQLDGGRSRGARAAARPVRAPRRARGRGSRARARRRGRAGRRAARGGGRVRRRDRLDRPGHAPPAARGGRAAEPLLLDRRRDDRGATAGGSTSSRATPPSACSARPARARTPPATRCARPARSTSA